MDLDLEEVLKAYHEEKRLREEAERQREEAESQREEAEQRALQSEHQLKHTTVLEYLAVYHEMLLNITVAEPKYGTTGFTTDPTGRFCPARIIRWDNGFKKLQDEVWKVLKAHDDGAFLRAASLPLKTNMEDRLANAPRLIAAEYDVRAFATYAIEQPVRDLFQEVQHHEGLKKHFGLSGNLSFQSHAQGLITESIPTEDEGAPLEEALQQLSLSENEDAADDDNVTSAPSTPVDATRIPRKAKGRGLVDQFSLFEPSRKPDDTGADKFIFNAVEYKAPHKFSLTDIINGSQDAEIRPKEEIINKEEGGALYAARRLFAAVITQAYSYMIERQICYGYVYTAEAVVFLYIPVAEPSKVYYNVSIPTKDAEGGEANLHATAAGQVFAFVLHSLSTILPSKKSQKWNQKELRELQLWPEERIDVLKDIPATEPREPNFSAYKPTVGNKKAEVRSPIITRATRSGCCEKTLGMGLDHDSGSDNGSDSPTPKPRFSSSRSMESRGGRRSSQSSASSSKRGSGRRGGNRSGAAGSGSRNEKQTSTTSRKVKAKLTHKIPISSRPYCTHECLLGILHARPLDPNCPNLSSHKHTHIDRRNFLRLLRHQLLVDDGDDADCEPLYLQGSRGALFKICLTSHGYTFVAKGMEAHNLRHLIHENKVYKHMSSLQGKVVPVCLGTFAIDVPWYFNGGAYIGMLCLSWAGVSMLRYKNPGEDVQAQVRDALKALHALDVLHNDPENRNILYDERGGSLKVIFVDFERAEVRARKENQTAKRVLSEVSSNTRAIPLSRSKGAKGNVKGDGKAPEFKREYDRLCLQQQRGR